MRDVERVNDMAHIAQTVELKGYATDWLVCLGCATAWLGCPCDFSDHVVNLLARQFTWPTKLVSRLACAVLVAACFWHANRFVNVVDVHDTRDKRTQCAIANRLVQLRNSRNAVFIGCRTDDG